jgi:hypothetical protein
LYNDEAALGPSKALGGPYRFMLLSPALAVYVACSGDSFFV